MNKLEFIKLVKTLDLPVNEYCILSGGALLMAGLREQTNDLDIAITPKGFELIKKKYNVELKDEQKQQYQITENIECFISKKLELDIELIEGYPCESLMSVYKFKTKVNRQKDQQDIVNLKRVLNIN